MAISYGTIFAQLGKLFKYSNAYLILQGTTLLGSGSGADDILDQYNGNRDLVPTLERDYIGFASAVKGWIGRLKFAADSTLGSLRQELNAPNASPSTILPLLYTRMIADAQSIAASAITTPTVTAGGANVGNGSIVASKKDVNGNDDQRIITESARILCVTDSYSGAAPSGGAVFSITGYPDYGPNDWHPLGNGAGPNLATGDAGGNLLTNGTFEAFTANVPDGWALSAGTPGTNSGQDLANFHRGAGALKLIGDGATGTITIKQVWNLAARPSTIYAVGVWVRKNGTVTAGSSLSIAVKGTALGTKSLYSADPNGLTTSYALKTVFFATGATVDADLRLEISWTTANAAGATAVILIDDAVVQLPVDFGHTQLAAFAGNIDFARNDLFTLATVNDYAGVFSQAFARWYDAQLPTSGTPTISDTLAT